MNRQMIAVGFPDYPIEIASQMTMATNIPRAMQDIRDKFAGYGYVFTGVDRVPGDSKSARVMHFREPEFGFPFRVLVAVKANELKPKPKKLILASPMDVPLFAAMELTIQHDSDRALWAIRSRLQAKGVRFDRVERKDGCHGCRVMHFTHVERNKALRMFVSVQNNV